MNSNPNRVVYKFNPGDELLQIHDFKNSRYVLINKTQGHIVGASIKKIEGVRLVDSINECKNTKH